MPKELPNQIQSGSAYTERECFARLLYDLGNATTAAKGMAYLRKDVRWLAIAGIFEEIQGKATILMNKPTGIIVPPSMHRRKAN